MKFTRKYQPREQMKLMEVGNILFEISLLLMSIVRTAMGGRKKFCLKKIKGKKRLVYRLLRGGSVNNGGSLTIPDLM